MSFLCCSYLACIHSSVFIVHLGLLWKSFYNVKLLFWIGLGVFGRCRSCTTNCLGQALVSGPGVCAVKELWGPWWKPSADWAPGGKWWEGKMQEGNTPKSQSSQSSSPALPQANPPSLTLCSHRHCWPEGTSHGHPEEPGCPGQSPGTHPGSCRWVWPCAPSSLWHRYPLHGLRAPEHSRVRAQRKGKQPQLDLGLMLTPEMHWARFLSAATLLAPSGSAKESVVLLSCVGTVWQWQLRGHSHICKDKHSNKTNPLSFAVYWLAGAEICFTVCGALFLVPLALLRSIKQQTKEE